jgi:hypothetical protein
MDGLNELQLVCERWRELFYTKCSDYDATNMLVTGNSAGLVQRLRQVYAASYSENLLVLALDLPVENYQC